MKKTIIILLTGIMILASPIAVLAEIGPGDFQDIKGHWSEQAIQEVYSRGIMQGTGTDNQGQPLFAPENEVTRAQAAQVLTRIFSLDYGQIRFIKQPVVSDYYRDVDNESWFAGAALMCAINDIFDPGDYFYPDQPISRIEMARVIERCFQAREINIPLIMSIPIYKDTDSLSSQDIQAESFVTNTGIMKGDNGYFYPGNIVKRAELAVIAGYAAQVVDKMVDIDETYNGKQYTVVSGQVFTLSLPANPTTGYQWDFTTSYDGSIMTAIDQHYQIQGQSGQPLLGQGGRNYWRFKALKTGTTEINLAYARSWEKSTPAQTFTIKVTVASPAGQATSVSLTTQKVKELSAHMNVDLEIPVVNGMEDNEMQTALNDRFVSDAMAFKTEVASGLDEYIKNRNQNDAPVWSYEAVTRYTKGSDARGILSLYIDYYNYTGGAHGMTERRAYNIDMKTGHDLTLKNLFRSGFDYKTVMNQLIRQQINAAPDNYFSQQDMAFKGISDDQNFYLQGDNLVVYFGLYEIAPYAAGIPEFSIPLDQIKDGLKI